MLKTVLGVMLAIIVLGVAIPVVWPTFVGTDTAIQAMTETDEATVLFQTFWPIALLIVGLSIAVGVVFYGLRKFNVIG